jgi:L-asparaginase II
MAEPLIDVTRGEIVECVHRGDIAIVNTEGKLLFRAGNPNKLTYFRSAAKPIQAMNVILSGAADYYGFTDKELAIMCASHYAEEQHINTVGQILERIGLDKSHILSGSSKPLSKKMAFRYAWENREDDVLFNDCSGKHAGMLSVCLQNGYSINDYISPDHPMQKEIIDLLGEMTGFSPHRIELGIDGCSVPVHALPLYNMAYAYANLVSPSSLDSAKAQAAEKTFKAMTNHPFMIAGTDGFCTELIKHTNGKLIGKVGAEGIYCVGLKEEGIGIAVKIEDGSMDVLPPVVMKILETMNILDRDELKSLNKFRIINSYNDVGTKVGEIYPVFELQKV